MKKKMLLMGMLCMFVLALGLTSCNKEEVALQVRVTNNSSYSLSTFRITFENAYSEVLSRREFGDFVPNQTVTMEIPVGAARYYLSTYANGYTFFSPYYEAKITNLVLTSDMVSAWTTNSN